MDVLKLLLAITYTKEKGQAFSLSLCKGEEIKGYEWVGTNKFYSSGLCCPQDERWMQCGPEHDPHACEWHKRAAILTQGGVTDLVQDSIDIVAEGLRLLHCSQICQVMLGVWLCTP